MAKIYKVFGIEGKGLGCVASKDIERGALILSEKPQIQASSESLIKSRQKGQLAEWIQRLLKSFNQMNKADQLEFMSLYYVEGVKKSEKFKSEIDKFEKETEKAEKILKICNIFSTNCFSYGVAIKTSRFNHSCNPNATAMASQNQVRAIKKIKAGEEINISYLGNFKILRNRKFRQNKLFNSWNFVCSCDLCKNNEDETDAFEALIKEAEGYATKCTMVYSSKIETSILHRMYPLETWRRAVKCYNDIFEIGTNSNAQDLAMRATLEKGFLAAMTGYFLYKLPEFKKDAENFAKAVEKFGDILGNEIVTRGQPDLWKQRYQNFDMWFLQEFEKSVVNKKGPKKGLFWDSGRFFWSICVLFIVLFLGFFSNEIDHLLTYS